MEFFFAKVYARSYHALCDQHNTFAIAYSVPWLGLADYKHRMLENTFVNGALFLELLSKTARTRYTLQRFFKPFFGKKQVCNKFDFSMTLITDIKPAYLFYLKDQGKDYAFALSDMLNIIHQALTANIDMHSAPKEVLNPYTRSPFRHETLYSFFVKVHESHLLMPNLFYQYVKVGFDLDLFHTMNECALREYTIKSTVDAMSPATMHLEIRAMLSEIRVFDVSTASYKTVLPNVDLLPISSLKNFKPWLHTYYVHLYSLNPKLREKSYKKLIQSMVFFIQENPEFGVVKKGVVRTTIVSPVKISV